MANELLTAEQIAEIEAREKAAEKGPWLVSAAEDIYVENDSGGSVCDCGAESKDASDFDPLPNADFIAASRTDIPRLLADRRALLALLADIQWAAGYDRNDEYCPTCNENRGRGNVGKHKPACRLAAALSTEVLR